MPKAKKSHKATSSAILKWENAGRKLATTLSAYLQSCESLEILSVTQDLYQTDMPNRIELSLKTLHTKLFDELSQSRVILARMHNKLSSRFNSLPNEVLAEIFLDVVYNPSPDEPRFPKMVDSIQRIFGRLHCLLAVCSTWRNVVIEFGELWSLIPITDNKMNCPSLEASSLSLQRSQAWTSEKRHLHLAAVLYDSSYNPGKLFNSKPLPLFTTINIETRSKCATSSFYRILQKLLQSPSIISKMSINQYQLPHETSPPLKSLEPDDYLDYHMSELECNSFRRLIESLTTLRLRNINIHWISITFSRHLVDLHLQSVMLPESEIGRLLAALHSAPELRSLKLISIADLSHWHGYNESSPTFKVVLPKLQLLLLADLYLNTLDYVLASIAPGSYRTKVALTYKSWTILHYRRDYAIDDWDSDSTSGLGWYDDEVEGAGVVDLLERSNIDTLILTQEICRIQWANKRALRKILGSVPSLRSLVVIGWDWGGEFLRLLKRPHSDKPFPSLTELYILDGSIKEAHHLPGIAASHSLQTLAVDSPNSLISEDANTILRRLRRAIPDFRFVGGSEHMDELNYQSWRLW